MSKAEEAEPKAEEPVEDYEPKNILLTGGAGKSRSRCHAASSSTHF